MLKRLYLIVGLAASITAILVHGPAHAMGPSSSDGVDVTVIVAKGTALLDQEKFEAALETFDEAIRADPENPDAWNGLAYSKRRLGDVEGAWPAYRHALELDPNHRGANEYIGELYLKTGQPEKAAEHLAVLERVCPDGCPERTELDEAIRAYQASAGTVRPE